MSIRPALLRKQDELCVAELGSGPTARTKRRSPCRSRTWTWKKFILDCGPRAAPRRSRQGPGHIQRSQNQEILEEAQVMAGPVYQPRLLAKRDPCEAKSSVWYVDIPAARSRLTPLIHYLWVCTVHTCNPKPTLVLDLVDLQWFDSVLYDQGYGAESRVGGNT